MQQLLLIEIVHESGKERIFMHLPYKLVETGGPPERNPKPLREKGDLVGPYEPGIYLLTKEGKVPDGPRLKVGTRARLLRKGSDTHPWVHLGLYLVGETLPSAALSTETILQAVLKLQSWAEHGRNGKWKEELPGAEIAAQTLGFSGLEIVEYASSEEWTARPNRERSFPF